MKNEARLQSDCVIWFNNTFLQFRGLLFAVNNNSENAARAAMRKAMGLYPGVSDLIFLFDGEIYFIEMKTETGLQSKAQKEWEKTIRKNGFGNYVIIRNIMDFKQFINSKIKNYD